ncbi:MAG: hypothetical protein IKD61_03540 [Oscillospiraceae bacterium]|nr:hypothetical protein [Oscillospiraceae bacterium]
MGHILLSWFSKQRHSNKNRQNIQDRGAMRADPGMNFGDFSWGQARMKTCFLSIVYDIIYSLSQGVFGLPAVCVSTHPDMLNQIKTGGYDS